MIPVACNYSLFRPAPSLELLPFHAVAPAPEVTNSPTICCRMGNSRRYRPSIGVAVPPTANCISLWSDVGAIAIKSGALPSVAAYCATKIVTDSNCQRETIVATELTHERRPYLPQLVEKSNDAISITKRLSIARIVGTLQVLKFCIHRAFPINVVEAPLGSTTVSLLPDGSMWGRFCWHGRQI